MIWAAVALGAKMMGSLEAYSQRESAIDQMKVDAVEQYRRTRLASAAKLGETRVQGLASGVTGDSASLQTYLTAMSEELRKESLYSYQTALSRVKDARDASRMQMYTDYTSSMFDFGAANNWFQY